MDSTRSPRKGASPVRASHPGRLPVQIPDEDDIVLTQARDVSAQLRARGRALDAPKPASTIVFGASPRPAPQQNIAAILAQRDEAWNPIVRGAEGITVVNKCFSCISFSTGINLCDVIIVF